ncbi:MAG: hypothetical protein M1335_05840, partial [Chloroflexi bacterium]|nr:hypothetical protein [Chloroflexota bacterium]
MAKIGYLLHAAQSSEWYRAFVPGQVLASLGHEVTYLHEEDSASDFLEQDIVALIRAGKDTHVVLIDVLHGSGKRAVVDLDDNPWALPKSDPRVEEWERLGGRSALEPRPRAN